jgi:glycosyltransferase involved in cell wall biosynthesis
MEKLKVLLVFYEPQPSGQTTHVLSLVDGLNQQQFDLTVILPEHLERSIVAFQKTGADVLSLGLHKLAWTPAAVAAITRLIRHRAFDIIHIHSQEAGLTTRPLVRLAGARRVLYTPQTLDIRRVRWHWLYILVERALARITDVIISVNNSDRERLIQWGLPPGKVVTVPNGIDLAQFGESVDTIAVRQTLGLDARHPLVMQVGRLSAQKDPLAFIDGASKVAQRCPDARFAMVGDGPLRGAVTARIQELGLEHQIRMLGWYENARRLIAAADVVTLTSRWEGTPYVLLEAMGWSRPVIATAVNGCSEVIVDEETGFVVGPGDTGAWASRVIDLLESPAKATLMGRKGRMRVEDLFTVQNVVERIERLYLDVEH